MSIITCSTIGFGDEAASSTEGRIFGVFWMFIGEMTHLFMAKKMTELVDHGMNHNMFKRIDADNNGTLSKYEFTAYMLVKYGLISPEDLDSIHLQFERLDKDGNGTVTYE